MLASTKPGESAGTTGKAAPCPFSGKKLNGFYGKNIVLLPCSSTHGPASLLSPETNHDGTCYPCLYCNAGGGTNTDAHVSTSRAGYPSANENGRRHVNSHYPDADASAGNHESNAPPRHPQVTQGSRMRPDQPANPMLGSSRFPPVCSTPVGCGGTGPSPAGARTARTSAGQRPLGFSNRLPAASPKSMPAPTIPAPYARTEPWSAGAAVLLMMFPRRPRKRP